MLILTAVIYPIVCFALYAGFGSVVLRAAGMRVAPYALLPIGFAAFAVVGQVLALVGFSTPLNVVIVTSIGIIGILLFIREEPVDTEEKPDWIRPALAGLASFGMVIATILLSGRAALAGYLLDTTAGVQMLGADHLVNQGTDFENVGRASSSEAFLTRYFLDASYPTGSHVALGLTGSVLGSNLLWLYTPFMAVMAGVSGAGLHGLAVRLGLNRNLAVLAAIVAATPALAYSFFLQGSIKEAALLPCLIAGSLITLNPELRSTRRRTAVIGGVCIGGIITVIGLGGIAWAVPLGFALTVLALRRENGRGLAWREASLTALAVGAVALALLTPKLPTIKNQITAASSLSQSNAALAADPGNLHSPVLKMQAVGVWLGPSHRDKPRFIPATASIIAMAGGLMMFALIVLLRERRWLAVAWGLALMAIWLALTARGTMWLDAKLVMLNSFMVVLLVFVGGSRLRLSSDSDETTGKVELIPAVAAIGLFTLGVLASNALQYRSTGILPTDRYKELISFGDRYAKAGPGYVSDFDEYALYVLRKVRVSGTGFADSGAMDRTLTDGTSAGYGSSTDPDHLALRSFTNLNLAIVRRGPWRSNPGAEFSLDHHGRYYDVWSRNDDITVVRHQALGKDSNAAKPSCALVKRLKSLAERRGARLMTGTPKAPVTLIDRDQIAFGGIWSLTGLATGSLSGSGELTFEADVEPGQQLWWRGNIDRPVSISVDGKRVGTMGHESGGMGNAIGPVRLPAGRHTIKIRRGGATLAPGDNSSTVLEQLALAPESPSESVDVTESAESSLCSRQLDWLSVIKR